MAEPTWEPEMALDYPFDLNDQLHGHHGPRAENGALRDWVARLLPAARLADDMAAVVRRLTDGWHVLYQHDGNLAWSRGRLDAGHQKQGMSPGEVAALRHARQQEPTCSTCRDTGLVGLTSRGSDGHEPCPDCQPHPAPPANGWRCQRCGSDRWVSASLTGPVSHGGQAIRQCVPCGHYSNDPPPDHRHPARQQEET